MNKVIPSVLLASLCMIASVFGAYIVLQSQPEKSVRFGNVEPPFSRFNNSVVKTVNTTSSQVVATSTGRRLLILQNIGSGVAYCAFNGLPAVDQQGYLSLASSTTRFPIGNEPTYSGSVSCIASSTLSVLINEAY